MEWEVQTGMFGIHLRKLLWVYWGQSITITNGLSLGRSEMLRSLRH